MDGAFVQVSSQVQLNVSCSIKLFAGLLSFVDMNSKTTHTDALFGYSYSVVRPHFISNWSLDVDCTLSNCYQSFSVSFKSCLLQNRNAFHCNSLIEGAIRFQQTPRCVELHSFHVNICEMNIFRIPYHSIS